MILKTSKIREKSYKVDQLKVYYTDPNEIIVYVVIHVCMYIDVYHL